MNVTNIGADKNGAINTTSIELASAPPTGDESDELFNARRFIEKQLCEHPNVKITDTGIGCDGANIGILIEGCPFNINIKARRLMVC